MKNRNKISRRTYLKCKAGGLSALMALPFLEIMCNSQSAFAQGPDDPVYFGTIYEPNGVKLNGMGWFPHLKSENITDWDLSRSAFDQLKSETKKHLTVIQGLSNSSIISGQFKGGHEVGTANFLSGFHYDKDNPSNFSKGQGSLTSFLSEELAKRYGSFQIPYLLLSAHLDRGHATTQFASLDFDREGRNLNSERTNNLQDVFNRYFAGTNIQATNNQVSRRESLNLSIIDYVLQDAKNLFKKLGSADKQRMDQYLNRVRETEVAIRDSSNVAASETQAACQVPSTNPYPRYERHGRLNNGLAGGATIKAHAEQTARLAALALQCGMTPGFSYMLGSESGGFNYNEIGVNRNSHDISHDSSSTDRNDYYKINAYNLTIFERFIEIFRDTPVGGQTLLDRSLLMYGSGLGAGYQHSSNNIPIVWAGHANGRVRGGRIIKTDFKDARDKYGNTYTSNAINLTTFARAVLNQNVNIGVNSSGQNFSNLI